MTLPPSLSWIDDEIVKRQAAGLWRKMRCRQSPHVGGLVHIDGKTLIDFSSNDYLSLAADGRIIDAVRRAVGACGWGSGASPLVSGYGVWHARLEQELAEFEGTEASLVFPSGYAANLATINSLVDRSDLILSDALNHASIIDACRLSRAETAVYRHADTEHVGELLTARRHDFRRVLIVTDSVFSMDGDLAPLPQLVELAEEYNAMLVIDEAHATGVFGPSGRGVAEWFGLEHRIPLRVGTLSKSLGSIGGFVCGPRSLVDWIRNRGRTQIYSTAMPEAAAAASAEALRIARAEPHRRERLWQNVRTLEKLLKDHRVSTSLTSPIVPIILGESRRALDAAQSMAERGILAPVIREPTVPPGTARLRISLCHDHTEAQLEELCQALADVVLT